jgi:hypothetical protein
MCVEMPRRSGATTFIHTWENVICLLFFANTQKKGRASRALALFWYFESRCHPNTYARYWVRRRARASAVYAARAAAPPKNASPAHTNMTKFLDTVTVPGPRSLAPAFARLRLPLPLLEPEADLPPSAPLSPLPLLPLPRPRLPLLPPPRSPGELVEGL